MFIHLLSCNIFTIIHTQLLYYFYFVHYSCPCVTSHQSLHNQGIQNDDATCLLQYLPLYYNVVLHHPNRKCVYLQTEHELISNIICINFQINKTQYFRKPSLNHPIKFDIDNYFACR